MFETQTSNNGAKHLCNKIIKKTCDSFASAACRMPGVPMTYLQLLYSGAFNLHGIFLWVFQ